MGHVVFRARRGIAFVFIAAVLAVGSIVLTSWNSTAHAASSASTTGAQSSGSAADSAYPPPPPTTPPSTPSTSPTTPSPACATTILGVQHLSDGTPVFAPGATLHVISTGFIPNNTAQVIMHSTPVVLASVTADSTGSIDVTVHVPNSLALGHHELIVTMPSRTCNLPVDAKRSSSGVDAVAVTASPASSGVAGLAFTGTAVASMSIVAGLLLVGGTALLVVSRQRRRNHS